MAEKFYPIVKAFSRRLALALALLSMATGAFAQSTPIKGTVLDANGDPLVGVTVLAVGSNTGVSTLIDGTYTINVPQNVTQLQFQYLGLETVLTDIQGRTEINVTMGEKTTQVDEVVVIGYGVQRRRDLTGAVASVGATVLEKMPVASAAEAMQGRMAGVVITSTEGGPDAEMKIRIRGGGSITQDNSPLYIVDGFFVNSINDIPPGDIQSIDILKDASSGAIYGARGANGVVIVTTKSGEAGTVKVSFNGYAGVRYLSKTLDVLSPYEYVLWQYELANYQSSTVDNEKNFTKYYGMFDDLELYKNKKGTNWQDEIFGRVAPIQNYNLSLTGGSDAVKFNLNLTHTDDQSIMIHSGYSRSNINGKITAKISDKVSVDYNARFSYTTVDGVGTSTEGSSSVPRLRHTLKYAPTNGLGDFVVDDDYFEEMESVTDFINPRTLTDDEYRKETRFSQSHNGAFNWKVINGLIFRSEFGFTHARNRYERFYGNSTSRARQYNGPVATIESREMFNWRVANTLTYMPELGEDHDMTILLGQEATSETRKDILDETRGFSRHTTREIALANMGKGTPEPTITTIHADKNTLSFFGRVLYNYTERYLFQASLRADGSSILPPANHWRWFPSASFGWRMSEEPWMASTKSWLYNLKLRFSYGSAGNDRIPADSWRLLYRVYRSSKPISIGGEQPTVMIPSADLPNENLKWEITTSRDFGIDFGLFGNRLSGVIDFYWNTTNDLLLRANLPDNSGYSTQYQNIGRTSNKGIEITLDGTIVQNKDFRLGAGFNISFNKNKIDKLGETKSWPQATYWYNSTSPDADYWIEEGKPVGLIYGYVTEGMYGFDDFNYTYDEASGRATWELKDTVQGTTVLGASSLLPGMLKLKDVDGDGTVTTADRVIIGDVNPVATGGFNINAQWKGFDAAVYFNYSIGNKVYNANKLELTTYPLTRRYGNLLNIMENRFTYIDRQTGESLINDYDRLVAANQNANIWSPIISQVPVHSWAVEDGSFLRLSNLTVGYTLPERVTKSIGINSIRVYVTGYNLALFTKYSGYDPEVDAIRSTPLTPGVDYSAFPRARSFVAGLNITF